MYIGTRDVEQTGLKVNRNAADVVAKLLTVIHADSCHGNCSACDGVKGKGCGINESWFESDSVRAGLDNTSVALRINWDTRQTGVVWMSGR